MLIACTRLPVDTAIVKKKAPNKFKARFETTYGDFEIEAMREWSPAAVDRLYQLIRYGFYQDIAVFRVVPDFVVQFGISNNRELNETWKAFPIPDEPVQMSNLKGTISFARGGPQTRSTQIFVNLKDNIRLDTLSYNDVKGFPVVAKVTKGMEIVESFFGEYGNEPATKQDSIYQFGNKYLQANFPELDYIETAYIIK